MLERVGAVAVEGDELAVRILLARDAHLLGDEVVHGHLAAEGAGGVEGGARHAPLALVGQEDDGAVAEVKRRERRIEVGHVGESEEIFEGFGQEEVLVGGEGLVVNRDSQLGLDNPF